MKLSKETQSLLTKLLKRTGMPGQAPYRLSAGCGFDFSFVWLKPFVKIHSGKVSDFQPRINAQIRNPDGLDYEHLDRLCLDEGVIVPWSGISQDLGFQSVGEIEIAMRTSWDALGEKYARPDLANELGEYTKNNNIVEPDDNSISSFESRILHKILKAAGYESVLYINGWDLDDEEHGYYEFKNKFDDNIIGNGCASDLEGNFLVVPYFNDFFLVLNGSSNLAEAIRAHPEIEGFFCTSRTDGDWCLDVENMVGEQKMLVVPDSEKDATC